MSQAAVAAVSMFVPVDGPGSDSEFARMVSKASGGIGVQPVKDILAFSTDDTTVVVTEGQNGKPEMRVASKAESGKTVEVFQLGGQNGFQNSMRCRLTITTSAAGMSLPYYVTGTGLSQREVLDPSGMVVVKIPGFCMAGATDARAD
jgi:hypothetical protein